MSSESLGLIFALSTTVTGSIFAVGLYYISVSRTAPAWITFLISPIPVIAAGSLWGAMTDQSFANRVGVVGAIGAFGGALILVSAVELFRGSGAAKAKPIAATENGMVAPGTSREPRMASETNPPLFDQSIKADGNMGTISPTYNNNINISPRPSLDFLREPKFSNESNGKRIVQFFVNAPVNIPRLTVQAIGPGVSAMSIQREALGGVSTTSKAEVRRGTQDGMPIESFANAIGKYVISVQTTGDPTAVRLGIAVE